MQTDLFVTKPVKQLFFHYLLPAICGTMVTSIYVLADTIIIGKGIGMEAMAALNIVLPLFNIFFGTGLLFGVGGSVLMSIARGRGEIQMGHGYFSMAVLLNGGVCLLYMAVFLPFIEKIARFLGATDQTIPYVMDYAPYILWGLAFFSFSTFLQTFVRNDGSPKLAMTGVVFGGILNVILDIVFVFPLQMGMAGAAIASVLGSVSTCGILLLHFASQKNGLRFTVRGLAPSFAIRILKNGFTSFLLEVLAGFVMFIFNLQLLNYVGEIGVSMYGVITNCSIVVTCLCNGINQASQPIVSINYGAGEYERIRQVKAIGLKTAFAICGLPALLGLLVPDLFTYVFLKPNAEILALSKTAVRIYFSGFLIMGANMFIIGYFQAILKPQRSLFLCLARGCVLSILFVYILPQFWGVTGIWAAVPLAELCTFVLAVFFLKKNSLSP